MVSCAAGVRQHRNPALPCSFSRQKISKQASTGIGTFRPRTLVRACASTPRTFGASPVLAGKVAAVAVIPEECHQQLRRQSWLLGRQHHIAVRGILLSQLLTGLPWISQNR